MFHASYCPFHLCFRGIIYYSCCTLGTNDVSMPVPDYGAPGAYEEIYCVIFFVYFHGSRLHRCTFPFGLVCRDLWCNNFYTVLLCTGLPSVHHQVMGATQAVYQIGQTAQMEMCSSWLLSPLSFLPPLKLCYKAHLKDVQASPHPPYSWLCIDLAVSRRAKVLEVGSSFQSHCLLNDPGI